MSPQPRTVVEQDPLVKAIIAVLTYPPFTAYDNEAPKLPPLPYTVVYSLDDAARSGTMWDWGADVVHTIQTTSVGETAEQARMLRDRNRTRMLRDLDKAAVSEREISLVDLNIGGGVERDETEQPRYFYAVDIWQITTTPNPS